ncbi:hypothetical protein EWM62_10460 [Mucilaginibacter terrigena]|uniref:Uncharacterized protein n=1 Tax=Mucilaginibacter terrigena TaxID=2492395 RepID=A0A4V1ZBQ3_9SPHI|nr:DUF6702 family protein [Mucilaginibacter terrigena]RYU89960.1 hypothetical protein EWM62_10460 [Mucilaginibacter terrigena]
MFFIKTPDETKFHPLHVSTTDVSFNAKDDQLEVICTIFTDDFELALEKQFHSKVDLVKPDMHTAMDVLVKNYVNSHLQLKTTAAALPLSYLGFEINREAVNVYLESGKIATPKKIDAQVTLLQSLYADQLNIVHMTVNGTRKSTRLDAPDKTVTQTF